MSLLGLLIGAGSIIVLILLVKAIEEARGVTIVFPNFRARADRVVLRGVVRAEQGIHTAVHGFSRRVILGSLRRLAMSLISVLHVAEERIVSLMGLLRGRSGVRTIKHPAEYLRSVARKSRDISL